MEGTPEDSLAEEPTLAPHRALEELFVGALTDNPLESLCVVVGTAAGIFYAAEKDHNPAVNDYWDAFHYVATSLSVGYANIFPVTQVGKIVGAVIMMIGPSLSARALERPSAPGADEAGNAAIVAKLDEILIELKRLGQSA